MAQARSGGRFGRVALKAIVYFEAVTTVALVDLPRLHALAGLGRAPISPGAEAR